MPNILHDKVFDFCESYRASHPGFLYWLRERNTNGKLDEGIWFQGSEKYAFVGLYDANGGPKRTRSIGLVFTNKGEEYTCTLEVGFPADEEKKKVDFYKKVVNLFAKSLVKGQNLFQIELTGKDAFIAAANFLDTIKPQIDELVKQSNLQQIFITPEKFNIKLKVIMQRRTQQQPMAEIKYILVNISWNSNDWKGVSEDKSEHKWISKGNNPYESWNFDFENSRNTPEVIRGYCKFTNPPKIEGNNNLIIFYSQNQIVGFYGKAIILPVAEKINEQETYNLVGSRPLCILLKKKIKDAKEKGYLEDELRVGQISFSYLNKKENVYNILNEALELNPEEKIKFEAIKYWLNQTDNMIYKEIEIEYPSSFSSHGQFQKNFVKELSIPEGIKKVSLKYNGVEYEDLTLGQDGSGWGRIYFPNKGIDFINNNNGLVGGQKITVEVGWPNEVGSIISIQAPNQVPSSQISLNQILFGPPGTGKTYHTITESVRIVDPEYFKLNATNRNKLQDRFNELIIKNWIEPKGQISFCTFHQSFSYEDFVEGIKPITPKEGDTFLKYKVEWGIFKNICQLANADNNAQKLAKDNLVSLTQEEFNKAIFYKISLGDSTKEEDKEIYDYCISNNLISIGFGESTDFTGKDETQVNDIVTQEKLDPYTAQAINYFKNYLKVGNYVVVSYGNSYIRALGKVTGDYEYKPDAEIRYKHFRKVDWVFKNVEIPVAEFYQKNLSQQTIYKLKSEYIIPEFFIRSSKPIDSSVQQKKFVLVIDEINRGNVSSIFGELITLVEPSKRSGKEEALEVVLPYSKERFTVPSNVYLIGTMNTADRSIESLDTALRRRFSFKEMVPEPGLILTVGKSKGVVDGIDIVQILQKINERIEKLIDKDHKIGHSYFLDVLNAKDLELVFKDKVIPLLEEYFFGDFGKIGLVLGNSFIRKEEIADFDFAVFADYDAQTEQDLKQRPVFKIQPVDKWEYKSIYQPKSKT